MTPLKVLYICTHNRCRSILSEAITNELSDGSIVAYSAGSQPAGAVHPLSLGYLQERGLSTEGLQSQSWDDYESMRPDVVITVCDSAANETCPVWFTDAVTAHWGLPDPSKLTTSEHEIRSAFFAVMLTIENRVKKMLSLDIANLTGAELKTALEAISRD